MSLHLLLLAVQVAFGAALFWSCFCRLVRTDLETYRDIRLAIWFEGVVALLVLGAPFMPWLIPFLHGSGQLQWQPGDTPRWIFVLLLVAAAMVQMVTARFWRYGAPEDFKHRDFK